MSNATQKSLPAFRVFSVTKNADCKPTWTEIGAAYRHKDRRGFSLLLTARPVEGAQIVLRLPKTNAAPQRMLGRYDALRNEVAVS